MDPVTQAPPLRRVNGFGFSLAGRFYDQRIAPAYFSLYLFFALWIPIVPLLIYVVSYENGRYRFYRKLSFGEFHQRYGSRGVVRVFASAAIESALFFVLAFVLLGIIAYLFGFFGAHARY